MPSREAEKEVLAAWPTLAPSSTPVTSPGR